MDRLPPKLEGAPGPGGAALRNSHIAEVTPTAEQIDRLNELFNSLVESRPEERTLVLNKTAATDAQLSSELKSMLDAMDADRITISGGVKSGAGISDSSEFAGTDRFTIERRLGAGGFGTVYQVYDREWKMRVALKLLRRNDPAFLYRFKREFRSLADVNHPNLVSLHELFSDGNHWFFTMELVNGTGFLQHVGYSRGRMCNLDLLRPALQQLAHAITALHQRGMLHRDIKPSNVMVTPEGRVVLLDFGLVRESALRGDEETAVVGTPAYMSPEQLSGRVDEATDWYAMGVMLFQAVTGSLPFTGGALEIATKKLNGIAPEVSQVIAGVPEDLAELCRNLLRAHPADRPSATRILAQLASTVDSHPGAPRGDHPDRNTPLIGRESHLTTLHELLEAAMGGTTAVANLRGRSGMGKSTLLQAFLHQVKSKHRDVVVLYGGCHENERVPFKALDELIDALSRYLQALPASDIEAILPRDAELLGRVFPVLRSLGGVDRARRSSVDTGEQELRKRAFLALQEMLARLADRRMLVLAVDDLQWGDLDSVPFFSSLIADTRSPGVLFIASYRSEEVDESPFLKAYLSDMSTADARAQVKTIEVGELSPSQSKELATGILGKDAAITDADTIAKECAGSPFLIEQFARYRTDFQEADDTTDRGGLRELIAARLSRLSGSSRTLLELISVAGQPIAESVLREAASLGSAEDQTWSQLLADRLIRIREKAGRRELETYHDKIRDNVVAAMHDDQRVARHHALATALARLPCPDPAVLAFHFERAGLPVQAAIYAIKAAENAAEALAFDGAAYSYRQALVLGAGHWSPDDTVSYQKRLAEVLVNAGRGVEAATLYEDVAQTPRIAAAERLELRRRAAEQFLRSGHLEQGQRLLGKIASELNIWLAQKPWQALLSLLWHRSLLRFRGLGFREVLPEEVPVETQTKLEVYSSLAVGLGLVDVIRGADFHARHLLLALRTGEANHIAMAFAFEAGHGTTPRRRNEKRSQWLLDSAEHMAKRLKNHRVISLVASFRSACAWLKGEWATACALGERGETIIREHPIGVAWELATNHVFWLSSLIYLGAWKEYAARLPVLLEEAQHVGDLYGTTSLLLLNGSYTLQLVEDDPASARRILTTESMKFPSTGFYLQHFWAMYGRVEASLYAGDGEDAWSVVDQNWSSLVRSRLLRVQALNLFALNIRGRAALGAAVALKHRGDPRYEQLLREAKNAEQQIRKENMPWSQGLACLLGAGISATSASGETAVELLKGAEGILLKASMAQYVAAARFRLGKLVGGDQGDQMIAAAAEWMAIQKVVRPDRMIDMLAPGDWPK